MKIRTIAAAFLLLLMGAPAHGAIPARRAASFTSTVAEVTAGQNWFADCTWARTPSTYVEAITVSDLDGSDPGSDIEAFDDIDDTYVSVRAGDQRFDATLKEAGDAGSWVYAYYGTAETDMRVRFAGAAWGYPIDCYVAIDGVHVEATSLDPERATYYLPSDLTAQAALASSHAGAGVDLHAARDVDGLTYLLVDPSAILDGTVTGPEGQWFERTLTGPFGDAIWFAGGSHGRWTFDFRASVDPTSAPLIWVIDLPD